MSDAINELFNEQGPLQLAVIRFEHVVDLWRANPDIFGDLVPFPETLFQFASVGWAVPSIWSDTRTAVGMAHPTTDVAQKSASTLVETALEAQVSLKAELTAHEHFRSEMESLDSAFLTLYREYLGYPQFGPFDLADRLAFAIKGYLYDARRYLVMGMSKLWGPKRLENLTLRFSRQTNADVYTFDRRIVAARKTRAKKEQLGKKRKPQKQAKHNPPTNLTPKHLEAIAAVASADSQAEAAKKLRITGGALSGRLKRARQRMENKKQAEKRSRSVATQSYPTGPRGEPLV